jgi:alpha-glucosidase
LPATLGKQRRLDGHGLLQGHLDGNQLQLPGYGVWFASVE